MSILNSENNRQALGRELGYYVFNPQVVFKALEGFCADDPARKQTVFEHLVYLRLLVTTTVVSTRFAPDVGMPLLDAIMNTILLLMDAPMNAPCRFDFLAGYTRLMPTYFGRIQRMEAYDTESFIREAATNFVEVCECGDDPALVLLAASGLNTWVTDVTRFFEDVESGGLVFEGMDPAPDTASGGETESA